MPNVPGNSGVNTKKKKKGPAPAHQNKFAWRHNPKSKKTEIILASPNVHVCRRCHDKIEWRKQYRKYKPLTQPSKCNLCEQKNVKAAYHTICTKCTQHSTKATSMIQAWNLEREEQCRRQQQQEGEGGSSEKPEAGEVVPITNTAEVSEKQSSTTTSPQGIMNHDEENDDEVDECTTNPAAHEEAGDDEKNDEDKTPRIVRRVCAVCVKEPALPASDDEADDETTNASSLLHKLSLRERKRLERESEKKKSKPRKPKPQDDGAVEAQQNDENGADFDGDSDDDDDSDDDPFLRAIGGAENLLTGEAYQQKLLAASQDKN